MRISKDWKVFFSALFALDYKKIRKGRYAIFFTLGFVGVIAVNILRLFALILVGIRISPEIAVGFFHTNACSSSLTSWPITGSSGVGPTSGPEKTLDFRAKHSLTSHLDRSSCSQNSALWRQILIYGLTYSLI